MKKYGDSNIFLIDIIGFFVRLWYFIALSLFDRHRFVKGRDLQKSNQRESFIIGNKDILICEYPNECEIFKVLRRLDSIPISYNLKSKMYF